MTRRETKAILDEIRRFGCVEGADGHFRIRKAFLAERLAVLRYNQCQARVQAAMRGKELILAWFGWKRAAIRPLLG